MGFLGRTSLRSRPTGLVRRRKFTATTSRSTLWPWVRESVFSANRASGHEFSGIFIWSREMVFIGCKKCHSLGINKLRISNCGKYLLAASRDKSVSLHRISEDGRDLELVRKIEDHRRSVFDCGFNYDTSLFGICVQRQEAPGILSWP